VSAEVCEVFLPVLKKSLELHFHHVHDPHLMASFAIDSLMNYLSKPERFDPARSSLLAYLYMDACGDLLNYLDKQKRFVELHASTSEHDIRGLVDDANPERRIIEQSFLIAEEAIAEITDPTDRRLLELILEQVRETEAYADVLGLGSLEPDKKAAEVKKRKDRLKVRLKRKLSKIYGNRLEGALHHLLNSKSGGR
jgi:DNA-directed RNA polymerase specialized sigma24 family protein